MVRVFIVLPAAILALGFAWNVRQGLKTGVVLSRFRREIQRESQPRLFKISLIINGLLAGMCAASAALFGVMPTSH